MRFVYAFSILKMITVHTEYKSDNAEYRNNRYRPFRDFNPNHLHSFLFPLPQTTVRFFSTARKCLATRAERNTPGTASLRPLLGYQCCQNTGIQ